MLKYHGVFLIRKDQYEQLDRLKDKMLRILKHPGIGSSIPWTVIRMSFLIIGLLLGVVAHSLITVVVVALSGQSVDASTTFMLGLVLIPIIMVTTYKALVGLYFRKSGEVHEMNTFLVALSEYKNVNDKNASKIMNSVEQKVSMSFNRYSKQLLAKTVKEVHNDLDIKAFRKDYETLARILLKNQSITTLPSTVKAWQEELVTWSRQAHARLLHDSRFWIWQDVNQNTATIHLNVPRLDVSVPPDLNAEDRSSTSFQSFTTTIHGEPQQVLHHLDELTIATFFMHHHVASLELLMSLDKWMPQVSKTVTSWTERLSAIQVNNSRKNGNETTSTDDMELFEASMQDPLADLTLLMINKLSGSAEMLLQQARQKAHMATLTNMFLKQLEEDPTNPFFATLKNMLAPASIAISEAESHVAALQDYSNQLIKLSMLLRDVQTTVKRLGIKELMEQPTILGTFVELLEDFLPFYQELEKTRFFTQWFEDIEHFTALTNDVALESGTEEINVSTLPKDVILAARNLFKQYQGAAHTVYALRGVSLDVKQGEFLVITGPSGSGKTTLLNVLSGLDTPNRGVIMLDGQDITKMSQKELTDLRRDKIGFVFQFYNLLPVLNAQENVAYPREIKGEVWTARKRARHLLEQVGLGRFLQQTPNKLSGGQMQRVTIARSLQNTPKIIFADEPTGDLDHATGEQVMQLLKQFHDEGHTIILVTHDLSLLKYGTRWIEMRDGQIIRDEPLANAADKSQ